jgi:hypothetical protein
MKRPYEPPAVRPLAPDDPRARELCDELVDAPSRAPGWAVALALGIIVLGLLELLWGGR